MTVAPATSGRREIEVVALIGFAHSVSHFFQLMMPALFPWLLREFDLTFTQLGVTTAVFFTVSGVGQVVAGFVVDRVGARRALLGGIVLLGTAGVILGFAPNYATLILAAAVAGAGNSVFHPADFTLLNRNVSGPRLGHAFSVHGLSGNLGYAAAPVFMAGIALAVDWRTAAFAAAGLSVAALLPLLIRRRAITPEPHSEAAHPASVDGKPSAFAFLGTGAVWLCFVFFLVITAAAAGLQNFGPLALHHLYGMSLAAAASALTAMLLGGAAGMAVGGFLVARNEVHDRLIAVVLVCAGIFALGLASGAAPVWSVTVLMAGLGFCTGMAGPSRDMLVRRAATARFGASAYGRVYGFVYSGLDVGFALSPVLLFGPLMDAGRFAAVLIAVAVLQCFAVLAALSVGRGVAVAPMPTAVPLGQSPGRDVA
jgi:FSR family fosmidomycin resistance protein-like MFS transporter